MWVLKFLLKPIALYETVISKYAQKFNLSVYGYPLTYSEEKGRFYFTATGFVHGEESKVKAALKEMSKDSKVGRLESTKGMITLEYEGNILVKDLYDPHFIMISPIKTSPDGTELWELASWERERLNKLISVLKKKYAVKILSILQKKIDYFSMIQVIPRLTEKQRTALLLAIEEGYYDFPKKIELEQLARLMKLSFSTYRQHLRTAEGKFFKTIKAAI